MSELILFIFLNNYTQQFIKKKQLVAASYLYTQKGARAGTEVKIMP